MAQRPTKGTAPVPKENPTSQEDDPAVKPQEKSQDTSQSQGTIAVVKSKIREKDFVRPEEDTRSSKIVSSKSRKLKRGSSTENIVEDEVAKKKSQMKHEEISEKSEFEVKPETESKSEEAQGVLTTTKSKKSMAKIIPSRKSLGPREDEQAESLLPKKSEIKREMESAVSVAPTLSGAVTPAPEPKEQKSEAQNLNKKAEVNESFMKRAMSKLQSQKPQTPDRKNYLASVYPEPLDENQADVKDETEPKKQEKPDKNE